MKQAKYTFEMVSITTKEKEELQKQLKKLGYRVTYHPNDLRIHTRMTTEEYVYWKTNEEAEE